MLSRLIYSSRLQDSVSWTDVVNIASHSRTRNEGRDITGMLILNGNEVLQILEGDFTAINRLYHVIAQDERHHELALIHFGELGRRHFGRWKMKEVNIQRMEGAFLDVVTGYLDEGKNGESCFPREFERAYALLAFIDRITSSR
jgi:hypothetical protein